MKRREIEQRFDEIVEFSGVEKFIDTPVKRYSSGMYVRLAFAVAAHLEPEILLVDEVLAVGDAEFQQRCLGRMEDFGNSGRTVLFVSHNMQAVAQLCDRAILARRRDVLVEDGPSEEIVAHYLQTAARRRLEQDVVGGRSAPGDDLVAPSLGSRRRRRTARRWTTSTSADRVGIELGFTVLEGGGPPVFPKIKVHDRRAGRVQRAWTSTRGGTSRRRRATTSRPRGSPETCSTRARQRRRRGLLASTRPKLHHHVAVHEAVSFHVQDPAEGDSARGHVHAASGAASSARCSSGRSG